MKRLPTILIALLAAVLFTPDLQVQLPSAQERFAMELALCQEAYAAGKPSKCDLFGKIQVVEHFPDVKIQIVDHFPDIKVQWVDHFPNAPGKWQRVDHFPDYKVQFVDHFPDYKVKLVDHFPGCN